MLSGLSTVQTSVVVLCLQVQVDEYKQLKESLNTASNLGQHRSNAAQNLPAAPESQKDADVDLPQKDEPGHHLEQQDTEARVA